MDSNTVIKSPYVIINWFEKEHKNSIVCPSIHLFSIHLLIWGFWHISHQTTNPIYLKLGSCMNCGDSQAWSNPGHAPLNTMRDLPPHQHVLLL